MLPKRYPALAITATQTAAPRKLKIAKSPPAHAENAGQRPGENAQPEMKRAKKMAAAPWRANICSPRLIVAGEIRKAR